MNTRPSDVSGASARGPSRRAVAVALPMLVTVALFLSSAFTGGGTADSGLLPIVRFMAVLKLALGIGTAFVVGSRYAHVPRRWAAGQVAAGCMGLGAGFIWSASAFGAGFALFMTGVIVAALLIIKELERSFGRSRVRPTIE